MRDGVRTADESVCLAARIGAPATGVAVAELERAFDVSRFGSLVGRLAQEEMRAVDDALRRVVGLF